MNRPTRLALAIAACAGAFAGGAASANAATLDLALLGDSYTSGNGAGSPTPDGCGRSSQNWGQKYAATLRTQGFAVNAACGGGVVKDLDAQMLKVTPETDLVALTIGGNDVGFLNIVVQCFSPLVNDPARCKDAIAKGKAGVPAVQRGSLQRLEALKARLRPGAKVIVLSYPYLANPGSYTLRGLFNSFNAGKGVRELGDLGDAAIKDAAAQANGNAGRDLVTFVPTKDLFAGHEPNQDPYKENTASWIWEYSGFYTPTDIYHPKPAGQVAMAQAVLRSAGASPDFGVAQ